MSKNIEEKQIFQALVIADSFTSAFEPVTKEVCKVALNLVNTPLFDYTLDWLVRCEIDETIIYCKAQPHAEFIREHYRNLIQPKKWTPMKITVVASEDHDGLGDAMRDLYEKALLKPNFFLIYGDVVSNIDLKDVLLKHKDNMERDKTAIMTCVYLPVPRFSDYKKPSNASDTVTLTLNKGNKMLSHERQRKSDAINLITHHIRNDQTLSINPNFTDPCIAVCSEVVPSLFSDNFDYRSRDNLINGVIEQEELLGYHIYAYIARKGYARRVTSFQSYQEVSDDLLKRLATPIVPEVSLTSHRIRYNYDMFFRNYIEPSSKFKKECITVGNVLGAGTEMKEGSRVTSTIVGDHCVIEEGSVCAHSTIQNNVVINKGCKVIKSWIGDNAKLLENVTLNEGCVLGPNVIVGPNIEVPAGTRLSAKCPLVYDLFYNENQKLPKVDTAVCGAGGNAYLYTLHKNTNNLCSDESGEDSEVSSEEDEDDDDSCSGGDSEGEVKNEQDPALARDEDEQREFEFENEVTDSLVIAFLEKASLDKVILEINASRYAYNISMDDVLCIVVKGMITLSSHDRVQTEEGKTWSIIEKSLNYFAPILENYVRKQEDQMIVLKAIEQLCVEDKYLAFAQKILYHLNQKMELLDDEILVDWYRTGGYDAETFTKLDKLLLKMIEWLEESDEEDDEDEEDEESD